MCSQLRTSIGSEKGAHPPHFEHLWAVVLVLILAICAVFSEQAQELGRLIVQIVLEITRVRGG